MKRLASLILLLLFAPLVHSAPACRALFTTVTQRDVVIQGVTDPAQVARVKRQIEQTRRDFERAFGEVEGEIRLITEGSPALRTGYNFRGDTLQFPEGRKIRKKGLDSVDVVNHELFHLMLCRRFPRICPSDLGVRKELQKVHEAFADYFAYRLNPDSYFGENYHTEHPYLRRYESDLLLGLASGVYAEANVLTRLLIRNQVSFEEIRVFLQTHSSEKDLKNLTRLSSALARDVEKELSYRIADSVSDRPASSLRRYRLRPGETLRIRFSPSEPLLRDYPQLEIHFKKEDGSPPSSFLIQSGDGRNFALSAKSDAKAEKLLAVFSANGRVLGSRSFYFGITLPSASPK